MKTNKLILAVLLCFSVSLFAQSAKQKEIIKDSEIAKSEFIKQNAKLKNHMNDAKAYVIFPNVGKGALIVGAASGHGAVYQNGVLIGTGSMKQLDIGAQIGGEAYSELILFNSDASFERFKNDELEFTAQVSAVAVTTDVTLNVPYNDEGIAIFTLPKGGLMAEVSVGGQKFEYDGLEQ